MLSKALDLTCELLLEVNAFDRSSDCSPWHIGCKGCEANLVGACLVVCRGLGLIDEFHKKQL